MFPGEPFLQIPKWTVCNHHPDLSWDVASLSEGVRRALPLCLVHPGPGEDRPLSSLKEIDFVLVDDACIAGLHDRFMDVPGPTDVITFQHGEIVISLDTARKQAIEHGENREREVLRYAVHGVLHLHGWEDNTPEARTAMHAVQEKVMSALEI